jgi:hypothetical protein
MTFASIIRFIAIVNPLPRLLKLLPPKVAREVSVVLVTVAGVLIVVGRVLLPDGPVHDVVDGVITVLAVLGIRGEVTPVFDPKVPAVIPAARAAPVPARKVGP